ncbi:MAG: 50S ribosomal protein L18 [Candidatus Ranarchaeia archaeon]
MAKGPRYRVAFRRRREGKTNYYRRRQMLLSPHPRVVVRGSLNHMRIQIADAKMVGDRILVSAHSSELRHFGWKYHTGNIPSAYLVGYLAGIRAQNSKTKIDRVIADFGILSRTLGARIYASIKGLIDSGVAINCDEGMLPSDERIKGVHITEYAKKLHEENQELYKRQFNVTLKKRANPLKMTEKVEAVKEAIEEASGRKPDMDKKKPSPKRKARSSKKKEK